MKILTDILALVIAVIMGLFALIFAAFMLVLPYMVVTGAVVWALRLLGVLS